MGFLVIFLGLFYGSILCSLLQLGRGKNKEEGLGLSYSYPSCHEILSYYLISHHTDGTEMEASELYVSI